MERWLTYSFLSGTYLANQNQIYITCNICLSASMRAKTSDFSFNKLFKNDTFPFKDSTASLHDSFAFCDSAVNFSNSLAWKTNTWLSNRWCLNASFFHVFKLCGIIHWFWHFIEHAACIFSVSDFGSCGYLTALGNIMSPLYWFRKWNWSI